ncbi:MAG: hypothetical protein CTY34_05340 [Methylobacter sp.]|nr:MAG: hypothetical protein CTY34_05340 [Methylobacter sp.]PPD20481.1 MAG: hypothetical protein CTY24_09245 [Methylobacter sp.]PPD36803.1 MAG: hypothetical protein CTY18_03185 [Methylomonas sp.]
MKLQFNADLDYQHDAIKAVADIFEGQDTLQTNFTVAQVNQGPQADRFTTQNELGIGINDSQLMFPRIICRCCQNWSLL